MSNPPDEFREQLLSIESISPRFRESYERDLEALVHPPLTKRAGVLGTVLAVGLLITVALIARADVHYHVRGLVLVGHIALAIGFLWAAVLILRDLHRRRHTRRSVFSIASLLTGTAGTVTVVVLMLGLRAPSDPKSMFDAFYIFVFYFACAIWSLESRVANAELSSREQALRIECRLADLAASLRK